VREEETLTTMKVKGMSCEHCVRSVTQALERLDGLRNVQVDLEKGVVRFENIKGVGNDQVIEAITEAGYEVEPTSTVST
ncbi:MAG: cation transporter, partial [Treponemataceae bacterium]|nr:cation transporter [Treponemataceae bacterium]